MKKHILGTSAMALVFAFADPAAAAEWNVRVGGYYNAMVAYAETDLPSGVDGDFDGVDVKSNSEIFFLPSITLDNGIKIGANITLEGNTDENDQIDESFVYIQGSFGRVLIGSENSAGYKMHYAAPNAAIISFNSPSTPDYIAWTDNSDSVFRGTLDSTYLENSRNDDAKRVTYFTPRFSGFQIGVSYARDREPDEDDQINADFQLHNYFDLGANYEKSFGDFDVALSGRYGTADDPNGSNPTVWGTGINIGFGGITIGGSFAEQNDAGQDTGEAYDLGVGYATGPWTYSLRYFHGEREGFEKEEVDTFGLGINYQLAKGVRLNAFGAYVDTENTRDGQDISGWVIGTGIGLSW